MKLFNKPRFFRVTFCAALVLLIETVMFHLLEYFHEFFSATSVISYAVLGIGLGAFAASRIHMKEDRVFLLSTIGTTITLYIVSIVLVRHPALWAIATSISACIFFPTIYIAVLFREHPGGRVYLYDMAGAFLGVLAVALLYLFLFSEEIILLILTIVPLSGLMSSIYSKVFSKRDKIRIATLTLPLALLGLTLLTMQFVDQTFLIFKIFNRETTAEMPRKGFQTQDKSRLLASYDSLISRIDVLSRKDRKNYYSTYYNGTPNDHFKPKVHKEYDWFKERNIKWPTGDHRVFYGLKEDPKIYIIGAAARGIVQTAKKITPASNIIPVEIEPSIVKLMTKDFYKRSGKAYKNLKPIVGNAISLLRSRDEPLDIITLINTHSGPNIGRRAGPDFLHTYEHYNLFLDNLSDDGLMLFEERPFNRHGEFGYYRMLNTIWHVLKDRGVEDPSRHFLMWEWMVGKRRPNIIHEWNPTKNRYKYGSKWYVGMIVTKEPLVGERKEKALAWYHEGVDPLRMSYLKNYLEVGEIAEVMGMIEKGDFSKLKEEGFDASFVTNDRPFASLSTEEIPEVTRLLNYGIGIFLTLLVLFLAGTLQGVPKAKALYLSSYNVLIGFGYFLIEIMLMQVYLNIFVSAAWSLILVLGILLLSSGIGGMYGEKLKIWMATSLLIPVSLAAIYMPTFVVAAGLPIFVGKLLGVASIFATGFLLGVYFPRGLVLANRWKMGAKIPHLFAINSVAGSFAVILALYSGIKIGYQATVIAAVLFYCVAGLMGNQTDTTARSGSTS